MVLLTLATATACGRTDSGVTAPSTTPSVATLDPGFVSRAEAICAPYAAFQASSFFRISHFNRYSPDPALLPQVAQHLDQIEAYKKLAPALDALGPPDAARAAWNAVLGDFEENGRIVGLAIDAARVGDAATFVDVLEKLDTSRAKLLADVAAAGLGGTSCAAAEVDPLKPPPARH